MPVQDPAIDINSKDSILVSSNSPLAFIVGVAGFIGSHLAEYLLAHRIQVIGVDNFSTGKKEYLSEAVKNRNFHLINEDIEQVYLKHQSGQLPLNLPRIDYAFFVADSQSRQRLFHQGLLAFLELVNQLKKKLANQGKHKIVLASSIDLYNNRLDDSQRILKNAEIRFARFVKHHGLNGRIVRLATVFGPRMHFRIVDPLVRLIQASLLGKLQEEQTSLDFSDRALFVDDAVKLLTRSVLAGATAQKIFDGARIQPIKVAELRQILLDPIWHEMRHFQPTELPPWPTPNLKKTCHELAWSPQEGIISSLKKTVTYFKDNNLAVPPLEEEDWKSYGKKWSFARIEKGVTSAQPNQDVADKPSKRQSLGTISQIWRKLQPQAVVIITLALVSYAAILPVLVLAVDALSIRNHLRSSRQSIEKGDFAKAQQEVKRAEATLEDSQQIIKSVIILKRLGLFTNQLSKLEQIIQVTQEGISGVAHATAGTKALYETTKIISGEKSADPQKLYHLAQLELSAADQKIAKVRARLKEPVFLESFAPFIRFRAEDLAVKLDFYGDLVNKAYSASFILPQITALDGSSAGPAGKKTYLVLLQNNLELRAAGGFIGSYAKLTFEKGTITQVVVDDVYNLDGGLTEVIAPPEELRNDLGINRLFLRDSNFEPDFPTSARQAQVFFRLATGEIVNGVFALDLAGSAKLLQAVGGLSLSDYGEEVNGSNLFERAITHAEVNFFPGSQAKKNYLTSLQAQLFNKVFYLSNQNWPAITAAISESLQQKHLMIYLADPELFSYVVAQNWAGVMPRAGVASEGQTVDFLAPVESNMGANKANFYLDRQYLLETTFGKEGQIFHKLTINYQNDSPAEVFPAGRYKNRFRLYLPLGAKLTKVVWGEADLTGRVATFSDYGRTAYSVLVELLPKEQKNLVFEYSLAQPLPFKNGVVSYRLDVIKQAGTLKDPLTLSFALPINFELMEEETINQEKTYSTDLSQDRSFELKIGNHR